MSCDPTTNRVVAGRARERSELAICQVFRHRLGSGQARAERQGAAAAARRPVRAGARARRAAASLRGRRAAPAVFRSRSADQSAPVAAGAGLDLDRLDAAARRGPGAARVSSAFSRRSRTCRRIPSSDRDADGRASAREGSGSRAARAPRRPSRRRSAIISTRPSARPTASPATARASIGCTTCSNTRRIGSPTGGRRSTKSTIAGSSTSTSSSACGWRSRRCSRRPTGCCAG